jgi:hypothetical protein
MDDELARRQLCTCTVCDAVVDVCTVCHLSLLYGQVIRCRAEHGHDHATCATSRVRKLSPREGSTSTAPPPSTPRRRR